MNFSYTRKSKESVDKVVQNVKRISKEKGLFVVGETKLPGESGDLVMVCKPEWVSGIVKDNHDLIGLIPCTVLIKRKNEETIVSIGNPQLVGGVAHLHDLEGMLGEMDSTLRNLVNESAEVGNLKPSKVKVYATETCPYCKMEKAYLEEKGVQFDYVLVDKDEAAAKEMVQKTGQMGVPVTEIEYEDNMPEIIVGFDRPRINALLEIK